MKAYYPSIEQQKPASDRQKRRLNAEISDIGTITTLADPPSIVDITLTKRGGVLLRRSEFRKRAPRAGGSRGQENRGADLPKREGFAKVRRLFRNREIVVLRQGTGRKLPDSRIFYVRSEKVRINFV